VTIDGSFLSAQDFGEKEKVYYRFYLNPHLYENNIIEYGIPE
jgi:hypothetical protein